VELLIGADIIDDSANLAGGQDALALQDWARRLRESANQKSGTPGTIDVSHAVG